MCSPTQHDPLAEGADDTGSWHFDADNRLWKKLGHAETGLALWSLGDDQPLDDQEREDEPGNCYVKLSQAWAYPLQCFGNGAPLRGIAFEATLHLVPGGDGCEASIKDLEDDREGQSILVPGDRPGATLCLACPPNTQRPALVIRPQGTSQLSALQILATSTGAAS